MKKLLVVAVAAAGALAWRKVAQDKAEQDLWAEATDSIDSARGTTSGT